MLSDIEVEEIKKLINQGKSDYKIGKELGHSPNTVKEIREKYKESKVSLKKEGEMHFNNPIDMLREEIKNIKNIVEMGELNAELRRELEKLLEKLQETLRMEVDERIPKVKADAVEERDEEWRKLFKQDYVKKNVVTGLNNTIKARDDTISNLMKIIEDKDDLLNNNKYEISQLKASKQREKKDLENQIGDHLWENIGLKEEIGDLSDFIGIYLDDAGRWEQEKLVIAKTDFDRHVQIKQSELDDKDFETEKKRKDVEKLMEKTAKREENIKKQQQELDATRKTISEVIANQKKCQENVDNQKENIKERWSTVLKIAEEQKNKEQRLQKWQTNLEKTGDYNKFSLPDPNYRKPMLFDAKDQKTNYKLTRIFGNHIHPECIKKKKQIFVTLRPVLFSGKPVVQSGFSPIIRSGGEPMVIMSGLEPVVQSGFSSIAQPGEETKIVESSGGNMIQSGYSPNYYFGKKNLDKISKKKGTVSS